MFRMRHLWPVFLVLLPTLAQAEQPYVEAWATRVATFTELPGPDTEWFQQKSSWGGEVIGRLPITLWGGELVDRKAALLSLFGRAVTDGASGSHVFDNPATWHRLILEGGIGYMLLQRDRYSLQAFGGYGWAMILKREFDQEGSVPDRYGFGVHVRDDQLRMWGQLRMEWDDTVGPGPHLGMAVHLPLYTERLALGVEWTQPFGDTELARLVVKVKVKALK